MTVWQDFFVFRCGSKLDSKDDTTTLDGREITSEKEYASVSPSGSLMNVVAYVDEHGFEWALREAIDQEEPIRSAEIVSPDSVDSFLLPNSEIVLEDTLVLPISVAEECHPVSCTAEMAKHVEILETPKSFIVDNLSVTDSAEKSVTPDAAKEFDGSAAAAILIETVSAAESLTGDPEREVENPAAAKEFEGSAPEAILIETVSAAESLTGDPEREVDNPAAAKEFEGSAPAETDCFAEINPKPIFQPLYIPLCIRPLKGFLRNQVLTYSEVQDPSPFVSNWPAFRSGKPRPIEQEEIFRKLRYSAVQLIQTSGGHIRNGAKRSLIRNGLQRCESPCTTLPIKNKRSQDYIMRRNKRK